MNRHKYIATLLVLTIYFALTACSNHAADKSAANKIIADSSSTTIQQTSTSTTDTMAVQKDELTKIYSQAIADYIKAVYKKDKRVFDTLYFGKHVYGQPDDFPDIELPQTIENTKIKLVSPTLGEKLQREKKSLFYINLIGWVDKDKADFTFVTFSNGAEHKFDFFIDYLYNETKKEFETGASRFEDYIFNKAGKVERIAIYKDGKYFGDKSLK